MKVELMFSLESVFLDHDFLANNDSLHTQTSLTLWLSASYRDRLYWSIIFFLVDSLDCTFFTPKPCSVPIVFVESVLDA